MENFSYYAFVQVVYTSTIVLEIFSYYWKGNVKHEKKNYSISLKDQDYNFIATSINFQKTTLTFGEENKICPDNNCFYEFENTSFDNGFGAENSKFLSGTLKIEDKTNSEGNFPVYKFFKLSGLFNLTNQEENITTGEKVLIYQGNLLFDTSNEMFHQN